MNLEDRLNDWKKKLLDLGKRNALINFKLDSKSVLRLTQPSMKELWKQVVNEEKEIKFPYLEDLEEDFGEALGDFQFGYVVFTNRERTPPPLKQEDFQFEYVFTNREQKTAQRILRSLRKRCKTIFDEQGVNVLYLSFGFLEWTEGVSSKQILTSPLLLVPVSLRQESIRSPIILKIREDEIVINPTLTYKLNHDFGVNLPEYQDEEFDVIYSKLLKFAEQNKWKLRNDVCLSILSFLKINMYKDLEKHNDAILKHTIINALAVGGGYFN